MTWTLLIGLVVALALALAAAWHRHADLQQQLAVVAERAAAAARPAEAAPLQLPVVDLSRCLGCGTCVRSCPEDGVLQLVHGQASVVNAAACVGHARCVAECPTGAVTLGQRDPGDRRDVPVLDGDLQAIGTEGLFMVGEITARALIRSATNQGAQVAATIARRRPCAAAAAGAELLDVVIVGAGPGGLACALGCRQHGLRFLLIDQETQIGGTVAKYPRRKLVLTEPIELPLHGRMPQREYAKEELIALWQEIAARHQLPFRGGVVFDRVERAADGTFTVHTGAGLLRSRHVVLAIGRRGTPRRLSVPGEDLPHVAYSLLDAAAYTGQRIAVVGGGDSAVETALALAEQPGNTVALVHRQDGFFRIRSKNRARLDAQVAAGHISLRLGTEVRAIRAAHVELAPAAAAAHDREQGRARAATATPPAATRLTADHVFVMIGGLPPFAQLEQSGVSFDPSLRPAAPPAPDAAAPRRGFSLALATALLLTLLAIAFAVWHRDYYGLSPALRAADPKHAWLRPDDGLGLAFGIGGGVAILLNLAYLLRRHQWRGLRLGTLSVWMNFHVVTGLGALLLATLHAAMSPRSTPGGWAYWALAVLLLTGAIGRWFYAWLPRAANGRELELASVRAELAAAMAPIDGSEFARTASHAVQTLIERRQWRSSLLGRALTLAGLQWDLTRTLRQLRHDGARAGVARGKLAAVLAAARRAHDAAVATAHLEDLRALLTTWRWLHRWVALLMVLLVIVHVVVALLHGAFAIGGSA
jgi:thioredoxin reductase/ferredoxin